MSDMKGIGSSKKEYIVGGEGMSWGGNMYDVVRDRREIYLCM